VPVISLEGDFDNTKAMRAIYGSYNADLKRAQWKPSKAELDRFNFYDNIKTVYSRVLFSKQFQQNGTERIFVLTRNVPPKEECEDCVPVIGGAAFTKVGQEWQMSAPNKAITRTGTIGDLSAGKIVKLGNERYGVLFQWRTVNQGVTEEGHLLIAETKEGLKEVFSMVTGGNNKIYCEEKGLYQDDPACWSFSSQVDFVQVTNSDLYDLRVSSQGNKQIAENEIVPVRETKRFYFTDAGYRPRS
jgi:hypothetical protein